MGSSPTAPAKFGLRSTDRMSIKLLKKILIKCLHRCKRCVNISEYQVHDSVAQLDRAFDYESKGQGFESLLGHQMKASHQCGAFFILSISRVIGQKVLLLMPMELVKY